MPGDPYEVGVEAKGYADTAATIRAQAYRLRRMSESEDDLKGNYVAELKGSMGDVADQLDRVYDRFRVTSEQLALLEPALEDARAETKKALDMAAEEKESASEDEDSAARAQDELVDDVAAAADVRWRGRSYINIADCDSVEDGLLRRVERRADLPATGDAIAQAARSIEAVTREAGLEDVETVVGAGGFQITADDGDSTFDGGASLDVALASGTLTVNYSTSCTSP